MKNLIKTRIKESIYLKESILKSHEILEQIDEAAEMVLSSLRKEGKILLCGNGGSASDALHIAGEIVGRFQKERRALAAIALNSDVAVMTSIANDYGYERIFERSVEGLFHKEDTFIGISTSGNSENVYLAMKKVKEIGGNAIALLGRDGGKMKDMADISIIVPSTVTARIQEVHILIGHIICELVEEKYFGKIE